MAKREKNKGGRPTKMTEATLKKLREGFLMGYSDREACLYADIEPQTLYNYQNKNVEFVGQKEQWKMNPILKAKKTVFDNLDNPKIAQRYLETKCSDEFSTSQKQQITGGVEIQKVFITEKDQQQTDKHIDDTINEQ